MKIVIPIHSIIDVITNSSTELFIIDKNKGLEFVQEIVNDALAKFPSEEEYRPRVEISNPEWYEGNYTNIEESIKALQYRGYEIIAPETLQEPQAITVSWERGYMDPGFIKLISETFGVEVQSA